MDLQNFSLDQIRTALAANSFRYFVEWAWPLVSNDRFRGGYLVDAVCEHLQAVQSGQITRLVICCPIRHGKSLLTSVLFPVWSWLRDPSLRILSASCGEDLAGRDSLRSRHLIQNPTFQKAFGGVVRLVDDQNTKLHYVNDQGGQRRAVGTGTQTTGLDADYLLVDDLIDYKKAKSEAERKHALDFYSHVLSKRLVHGTGKDRIVIAGHRVHEEDLFSHVYDIWGNDGTWTYLVLPAEAKPEVSNGFFNGIDWKDSREEGELLCPERFPASVIEQEKKSLRHEYHCLYQQDPTPRDGDTFKPEWFRYYTEDANGNYVLGDKTYPKSKAWRFATVDTAVSTSSGADYTVCQVWDSVGNALVLVHQLRKRLSGTQIVPALVEVWKTYSPQFLCVESEFVGKFVQDQLKAANVCVKSFSARGHGDKETRAVAAEIRLEAGSVWFPSKPWVADLEREILSFPHGSHDDQVDSLAMAAILADKYRGTVEPELTPEEKAEREKTAREKRFQEMLWAGSPF